jgi:hypothetical protein
MSCSNSEDPQDEFLIFGSFRGFCVGNCTAIYKIENGELYEDNIDRAILDELSFKSTPLARAKYDIAKDLLLNIPDELLLSNEETIGCPDCYDQGGYYVSFRSGDGLKSYRIDTRLDAEEFPATVHYTDRIQEVLSLLE